MPILPFYLAHGAGAGHQSDFLMQLRDVITSTRQHPVIPVTFDYMKQQEALGKRRPPPRLETLIPEFSQKIAHEKSCIVAGKSMGGRVATQLSHLPMVKAIVCYGFPFYPVGKPEKHRLSFLNVIQVPCLIIQGTKDPLGHFDWVSRQALPDNIDILWIEGADHDFKTLKKYNKSIADNIRQIAQETEKWLTQNTSVQQ